MKRLSLKSLTFVLALSMATILLALPSCRSLDTATLHKPTQHNTTLHNTAQSYTTQDRDSIYTRDSIFESERQRADTVYRERIVYRDRIAYRDRWRERIVHDTIVHTDSIVQVIEHPPREVIPPFYKRCTAIFWTLIALLLLYVIVRTRYSIR